MYTHTKSSTHLVKADHGSSSICHWFT